MMSANGAEEGSQWQARSAPPLVSAPPTSMSPVRATELSGAPSARDHSMLRNQGLRGPTAAYPWLPSLRHPVALPSDVVEHIFRGIRRRWARERRRRKIGRAYDMALEIARIIPRGSEVLDVGCGNGFIAHHLSAMLGASVLGIDLGEDSDAPIDYRRYDGAQFPVEDDSFDAVLLATAAWPSFTKTCHGPGGIRVFAGTTTSYGADAAVVVPSVANPSGGLSSNLMALRS